jgi:hypothetical protein
MDTFATGFGGIFVLCALLSDAYLVAWQGDLGRLGVAPKRVCSSDRICVSPLPCKVSVSTIPLHRSRYQLPCRINLVSDSFSTDMLYARSVFWLTEALQSNIRAAMSHCPLYTVGEPGLTNYGAEAIVHKSWWKMRLPNVLSNTHNNLAASAIFPRAW